MQINQLRSLIFLFSSSRLLDYMDKPVWRMKPTILSSSSLFPYSFLCNNVPSDHICSLRCWYAGHLCSMCSVVSSSVPHLHGGDDTRLIFLCMCG